MAYEKRTWKIGEEITADKLNHMEDGIAEGGSGGSEMLIVTYHDATIDGVQTTQLDKTWKEIHDAFPNVMISYVENGYEMFSSILGVQGEENNYEIFATEGPNIDTYYAETQDEYPSRLSS